MTRRSRRVLAALLGLLITMVLPATPARADSVREAEWQLGFLDLARVHQISQGDGVTVAVLDSGVNGNHPDLAGNVLQGVNVFPGHPGNGWEDADPHGTAMAGLIAGHGHGANDGVLGVAPRAKVFPVLLDAGLTKGNASELAAGIDQAVQRGAQVISMSTGVPGGSSELRAAVERAEQANVVLIAATGNLPEDQDGVAWPARYSGVVAVGAVDRNGVHAAISVTGPQIMISAPGVDVVSTSSGNGYQKGTGTSDATAIVAGVVALIRSKYPNLSATEVIHRLTATARDAGTPGRDPEYGYGIVNPYAALTADVPTRSPSAPATQPSSASPTAPHKAPGNGGRTGLIVLVALVAIGFFATIWLRRAAARYRRSLDR